jgi:glutathione S-transferase
MRFKLVIGSKNYSSWSMRAWLLLQFVGARFEQISVDLYQPNSRELVRGLGGQTGLVPVLIDGELAVWDTLAIAETLYEEYPQIWPQDYARRARARSYSGEVHSGFNALREAMPVNVRGRNRLARRTAAVDADIARVCEIWGTAGHYSEGSWLFGSFCAADIMFAPVAARFQTYDVTPIAAAAGYFELLLTHPLIVEWFALGHDEPQVIERFELPLNNTVR